MSDENDTEEELEKEKKKGKTKYASIEKAKELLELLELVFDIYKRRQFKNLGVIPIMSSKKVNIEEIEKLNFDEKYKKRVQRKLLILQKVYIEGNPKEILGYDYAESKTFITDKSSLIEDLAVLLYGAEGINYRIIENRGLNL